MNNQEKREFIKLMLDAGVLRFGDFVTKSGRNTPYFVNTGNYKTGAHLLQLGKYYAQQVKEVCGGSFSALFGPAYKGIPLAAVTAAMLVQEHGIDKPYFFNRKEEKDHGEGGSFVGYQPADGDSVLLIEDVITAGTQIREIMPVLKGCADITIPHMFISCDRCEVGKDTDKTAVQQVREEFGVQVHAIVTVQDIKAYLEEQGEDRALLTRMEDYMAQYCVL